MRYKQPFSLLLLFSTCCAAPCLRAETPPPQQAAVKAIGKIASNIQKNRDGTVRFVRFSRPGVTDEHLIHLRAFEQLDYLAVVAPQVGDAGLHNVGLLSNLDTLFVSGTQLTDRGASALGCLGKLERLYLDGTHITDAALEHLAGMTQLSTLSLDETAVTDAGLEQLQRLPSLASLSLSGTAVTDSGLASLAKLPRLETLLLRGLPLTGSGLAHLAPLTHLETLDLSGTQVTPEHLLQLAGHASLRRLLLYDTDVSTGSLTELNRHLPQTGIYVSPAADAQLTSFQRFLLRRAGRLTKTTELEPAGPSVGPIADSILPPAPVRFAQPDEVPDFQRHVIPLLGRLGCNGRSCHGSFQGQGGFRLSMFGYDFEADHAALTADGRVVVDSPAKSLLLRKPLLLEEHEGGQRFEPGRWEHQLLARWIREGAQPVREGAPQLLRLDVTPAEIVFRRVGETVQLKVLAAWSDGLIEDVTPLARFETNDDTVAGVTPDGLVHAVGMGDTYVISSYDSGVFSTQTILPVGGSGTGEYPPVAAPTEIDKHVTRKLKKLRVVPSKLCSDDEFLRRVSLDIVGTLPTPDDIKSFCSDTSGDKRQRKIDELLEREAYVQWWTNLLCDLTGSNAQFLGSTDMNQPAAQQWRDWIRRRVRDNVGWDQIAAGILLATSRRPGQPYDDYARQQSTFQRSSDPADYAARENPMHYYWFRSNLQTPADRALSFGYVFLGVRLQCAQCHKHPFDQWSQQEFQQFSEFFTRIKTGIAPDAAAAQKQLKTKLGVPVKLNTAALRRQMYMRVAAEGQPIPWNEIYLQPPGDEPQIGKLLGGEQIDLNQYQDPREPLAAWLVSPQNPYFARAFVNRVWSHYFNVGVVDPPDDFNLANPPSNKALLDWLAHEFVRHGYDMKWLHRTIANSRTYQLSWRPNGTNRHDERNFSHAIIRRLPAEVIIDAILQATANDAKLAAWPLETKQRKIAQHPKSIQTRGIDYSLLVFGKPLRMTNCDCERQGQPSLLQSLYVRNDHELLGWLERPDGWLAQLARELGQPLSAEVLPAGVNSREAQGASHVTRQVADELITAAYLRTLSRNPNPEELARVRRHLAASQNTIEGLRDLMWALLNTQEFLTNH